MRKFEHPPIEQFLLDENGRLTPRWQFWLSRISSVILGERTTNLPIETVTTATTLNNSHYAVMVDATGGAVTVTLPAAAANKHRSYIVKKIDVSANAVTVDGNGAETIDDSATYSLASQYDKVQILSDGTEWWVI